MKARGEQSYFWKGGKPFVTKQGYIKVLTPYDHPRRIISKHNGWYIFEHRLVVEKHLGRYLLPTELVHHINGVKTDNRLENLVVVTKAGHNTIHFKGHLITCTVVDCWNPFKAKGLCKKHYHRKWAREHRNYFPSRYKSK